MFDANQLLERYRLLSRDIQNNLQSAQKQVLQLPKTKDVTAYQKLTDTLSEIDDTWQDFAGWILVSTLDDLSEARKNCAPGRLDIQSKLNRSKLRRVTDTQRNGIKINTTDTESMVVESYIPYFEQMLDLIIGNAIKYSPRAGHIEISNERKKGQQGCRIQVSSIGPIVQKYEMSSLGVKGFRSEAAKMCAVTGDGYGLYNIKRLAELLGITVDFQANQKVSHEMGGIKYASFDVKLAVPESPPGF